MPTYAKETTVAAETSRLDIEKVVERYGATGFAYASGSGRAMIAFEMSGRQVRFILLLPDKRDFALTETGRQRAENSVREAWEQACRQRWRALKLVVQAKLEAVECGISCFDDEFLANIVLPDGSLIGERMKPQLAAAYERGEMPRLLAGV